MKEELQSRPLSSLFACVSEAPMRYVLSSPVQVALCIKQMGCLWGSSYCLLTLLLKRRTTKLVDFGQVFNHSMLPQKQIKSPLFGSFATISHRHRHLNRCDPIAGCHMGEMNVFESFVVSNGH